MDPQSQSKTNQKGGRERRGTTCGWLHYDMWAKRRTLPERKDGEKKVEFWSSTNESNASIITQIHREEEKNSRRQGHDMRGIASHKIQNRTPPAPMWMTGNSLGDGEWGKTGWCLKQIRLNKLRTYHRRLPITVFLTRKRPLGLTSRNIHQYLLPFWIKSHLSSHRQVPS